MPTENEIREEVKAAVNGDGGETSAPKTPEPASSPEVKTETKPAEATRPAETQAETTKPEKSVSVDDLQKQIENLNIAIKKEREEGRSKSETLVKRLEESTSMLDRLRGAFNPEPETEPETPPAYLTPEQAEEIWEQKEQDRIKHQEELKQADAIKSEITTLETEWNGKDGKPKYDDQQVLEWQKNNNRLYLSPSEAFAAMAKNEIVDWEVKQRLTNKKVPQSVETPSTTPGEHEPTESTPKTEAETRQAVIEAMNNLDSDM